MRSVNQVHRLDITLPKGFHIGAVAESGGGNLRDRGGRRRHQDNPCGGGVGDQWPTIAELIANEIVQELLEGCSRDMDAVIASLASSAVRWGVH